MPKGAKNAPPQQSSLLDMWSKGKRKAAGGPKKEEEKDLTLGNTKSEVNVPGALSVKVSRSMSNEALSRRKRPAGGTDQDWSAVLHVLLYESHTYTNL
jgi:DNA ligase-1